MREIQMKQLHILLSAVLLSLVTSAVSAQQKSYLETISGNKPFVLIARLHAMEDQAAKVVDLSRHADERVEASEPGMLLHTFDSDPSDPRGFVWTEVYADSAALIFHLENPDLIAYLEEVSPLLDSFTVELYGDVSEEAVAQLKATGTPTTHYQTVLGYIRDLTP
jgi:quinol monooxygenase YgiN